MAGVAFPGRAITLRPALYHARECRLLNRPDQNIRGRNMLMLFVFYVVIGMVLIADHFDSNGSSDDFINKPDHSSNCRK
jgi:hypothetical protein